MHGFKLLPFEITKVQGYEISDVHPHCNRLAMTHPVSANGLNCMPEGMSIVEQVSFIGIKFIDFDHFFLDLQTFDQKFVQFVRRLDQFSACFWQSRSTCKVWKYSLLQYRPYR